LKFVARCPFVTQASEENAENDPALAQGQATTPIKWRSSAHCKRKKPLSTAAFFLGATG
jgi:hypothetical protein